MFTILSTNDRVKLLSEKELLEVFKLRNFFGDDETREEFANAIGASEGIVQSIEDKYHLDYFFLLNDGESSTYSIPSQSVYINMQ